MIDTYCSIEWGTPTPVIACYANIRYFADPEESVNSCEVTVDPASRHVVSMTRIRDNAIWGAICSIVDHWEPPRQILADFRTRDFQVELYRSKEAFACTASVRLGNRACRVLATEMVSGQIHVYFDKRDLASMTDVEQKRLRKRAINSFRDFLKSLRTPLEPPVEKTPAEKPTITFREADPENGFCLADVRMPDGVEMTGLNILYLGNGKIEILKPDEPEEKRARVSGDVRGNIREAFLAQFDTDTFRVYDSPPPGVECTPYGRVKNAVSDSFLMARRNQVLREEYLLSAGSGYKKKSLIPISRMQIFSEFEIDLLSWINELRYATSDMLTDLVEAGLLSEGGVNFRKTKLPKQIKTLSQYGIVDVSQFATLDDEGKLLEDTKTRSIARIYTLGKNGANMLGELGRGCHYNAFERFQDGNIVKAILAVNQWLVYWLSAYPEEMVDHYESSRVVYIRDARINGARIHASVVRDDCILIGEPIRRSFRKEETVHMCGKFKRFMMLFAADASSLYCSYDEVVFPERKILCYICEDEEHIAEVHEALLPYLREYPGQEIWYTTDLKMHNYNEEGKRFIAYGKDGTASFVNVQERLSLGRERAWQTEA